MQVAFSFSSSTSSTATRRLVTCQRKSLDALFGNKSRRRTFVSVSSKSRFDPKQILSSRLSIYPLSSTTRAFSASALIKQEKSLEDTTTNREKSGDGSSRGPQPVTNTSTASKLANLRENIYTIPNILTVSRILACPVIGWSILESNYELATGLLVYAGLSDLVDGHLARKYNMGSVLGTILDPAADKILMTTLVVTLTMQNMIPLPLAVVILGRDVLLSLSAFIIRYRTLPPPKTWSRYWDVGLPSAEVRPTTVSKVNTALQLLLMGVTTASPLLPEMGLALQGLQWTVATTTIWSGLQYLTSNDAVKIVNKDRLTGKL